MDAQLSLTARIALLSATLAYAVFVVVLGLTPAAWEAAGRPNESYPELFYIGYGWPSALALLGANSALWLKYRRSHLGAAYLMWAGMLLVIWLCALVATTGLLTLAESQWTPTGVLETISTFSARHFHILLLAGAACVVVGITILLRTHGRQHAAS